VIFKFQI